MFFVVSYCSSNSFLIQAQTLEQERFGMLFSCCFSDSLSQIFHILHIGYLTCKLVKLCKLANKAGSASQLSHPSGMGAIQDDQYLK